MRVVWRKAIVAGLGATVLAAGCATPNAPPPRQANPAVPVVGSGRPLSAGGAPVLVPAPPRPAARRPARCTVFPADNIWHAKISRLPVDPRSAAYIAAMGSTAHLHPDFGAGLIDGAPFGMPVTTVPLNQPRVPVSFSYADESDPGPYPIPRHALIEGGPASSGDRHVIVYDPGHCLLYELYDATPQANGSWRAGSGAVFNLRSDRLRPAGWTSADAAGLPIMAGLASYDQVAAGFIDHAIRMTAPRTRDAFIWPARHAASSLTDMSLPPMGLRLRLRAGVDIAGFPNQARVVAQALKTYGAIIADNGSPFYIGGTQDSRWNNSALDALKSLTAADFEVVDTSSLMISSGSGQAR
jgi:hypothetical protein